MGSVPELGRSPGKRNYDPLQYSCLEHHMNRGALWAPVHGVARVRHDLAIKPPKVNENEGKLNQENEALT